MFNELLYAKIKEFQRCRLVKFDLTEFLFFKFLMMIIYVMPKSRRYDLDQNSCLRMNTVYYNNLPVHTRKRELSNDCYF